MISRIRICSTLRKFLPAFLIIYFLLLTALLLKVPADIAPAFQNPPALLSFAPQTSSNPNPASHHLGNDTAVARNDSKLQSELFSQNTTASPESVDLKFHPPRPLSVPLLTQNKSKNYGSFYALKNDFFIYSAYLDDRKKDSYIRLLTLAKQTASRTAVQCHFRDEIYNVTRKAQRYELCENHNKHFGGYMYSCEVPEFINSPVSYKVAVSYGKSKKQFTIPLKQIRPPVDKLKFLDSYIEGNLHNIHAKKVKFPTRENNIVDGGRLQNNQISDHPSITFNAYREQNIPSLSFAVCVPPLFGDIHPYRLIEFIELTLLLGADHIFFYEYDVSENIRKVLSHYVSKGVITLTPWLLPSDVTSEDVWYNGQLLAHNDCLHRSMPRFDLVAFNDIDEFMVPHDNETTTWSQVFPGLISDSTCGLSFQSAFFDPGVEDMSYRGLLTPIMKHKTKDFSKIRSKVMVVPWRVFEVGIHHVSKQNRENWTVRQIHPSTAFLHHYRQCDGYDIVCSIFEQDDTVEKGYLPVLKKKFDNALASIGPRLKLAKKHRNFDQIPYW